MTPQERAIDRAAKEAIFKRLMKERQYEIDQCKQMTLNMKELHAELLAINAQAAALLASGGH